VLLYTERCPYRRTRIKNTFFFFYASATCICGRLAHRKPISSRPSVIKNNNIDYVVVSSSSRVIPIKTPCTRGIEILLLFYFWCSVRRTKKFYRPRSTKTRHVVYYIVIVCYVNVVIRNCYTYHYNMPIN